MLENYRTSRNFNEIVKILHHSVGDTKSFLWQSKSYTKKPSRHIFSILDLVVNERFNTFTVKISNPDNFITDSKGETYAKFSYKDTVFKVEVISKVSNNIALSLPVEVKAAELRRDYRHRFKPSDMKLAALQISVELIMNATQELKFQVIDISSGGMSIVISERDIKYFEDGSKFKLTMLADSHLGDGYELDFVYSQKFRFKSHGRVQSAYKVGLCAKEEFLKDDLMNFLG